MSGLNGEREFARTWPLCQEPLNFLRPPRPHRAPASPPSRPGNNVHSRQPMRTDQLHRSYALLSARQVAKAETEEVGQEAEGYEMAAGKLDDVEITEADMEDITGKTDLKTAGEATEGTAAPAQDATGDSLAPFIFSQAM